jgi:phospholipid-binding lipoprotein MlaA
MSAPVRLATLLLCLACLCGCVALPPGKRDPRDPWERMNRTTFKVNTALDHAILRPVARGYRRVLPQFAQTGLRNFFTNLDYTVVIVNDVLQGQVRAFGNDIERLFLNTAFGLGGFFDVATRAGLDRNDRELGQTLGKWGIKKGPYIVLPLLGPSDVRDAFGRLGDDFSTPRQYIHNPYWNYGLWTVYEIDVRASLLDYDNLVDSAYDPYAFLRNAYLQRRDFKVNGDSGAHDEEQQEQMLEDEADKESATPDSTAPAKAPPANASPAPQPPAQPPPANPPH